MSNWARVTFISAGAGSGKTYRLTDELQKALLDGTTTPAGIIGTTFTVKAAAELGERVRDRLLADGRLDLAERTAESLIGTVHSVCERLLKRFAFELGLSPQSSVMSIEDGARFFNQALDQQLDLPRVREMNALCHRLGIVDRGAPLWQGVVKNIADIARENDIDAVRLGAMGERNATALLGFFGEPLANDPTGELRQRLDETIRALPAEPRGAEDKTKKTQAFRQLLVDSAARLEDSDCPWQVWMRLAGAEAAKASAEHAATVREAALLYERHPAFQRDLRDFVRGIYDIAAQTMARFEQLKLEHGLIDFTDIEQLTLHALDQDAVRDRLRDEIELLLVDEFQDTNPMQLALFLKLSTLAKRAVFVGDVKQAIYEFRGCDPTLVFATLDGLAAGNAETDVLPNNWRSQSNLLHYLNELFAAALQGDLAPRHAVALDAKRRPLAGPAVVTWQIAGRVNERAAAVAQGVAQLVASGELVANPQTGAARAVQYGDIAVLARTNARVEAIAAALRDKHVPMKMTLSGLLATAEVALAKSCLRRVADRADTLATAEIMALADGGEPEQWLAERLRWLQDDAESIAWGEDSHPIVRRLVQLRDESALRSPVEIVARVLNEVDIRRIVAAWGPDDIRAAQRQKNLDAFLNLAVEYEKHAAAHHDPGTLTGFLYWLENPTSPDLDLQPVVTSGDAVHVLTYHRAKGLEWPVVVCTDFDYEERLRTWDARVELLGDFDIDAPLDNREIRYWPNIFDRRKKGVPARAAIEDSEEGVSCRNRTLAEQRRLAYVGMTRARDRLVLALPTAKLRDDAWLQSFLQDFAIPSGDELALPNGVTIPTRCEAIAATDERRPAQHYRPRWFERRERHPQTRRFLQPSSAPPATNATIGDVIEFGARLRLRGDDMADVGNGLHAVFAAELVNPLPRRAAIERATATLAGHRADRYLSAADSVATAQEFRRFVEQRFAPTRIGVEVPLRHELGDGRSVRGFVDLLAETPDGWLIVDHKSSPQRKSTWRAEALKHAGQLLAYRDALVAAGYAVAGCYIHFAVTGGLVEVRFDAA